jgi:hypothetical protein
VTFYEGDNDAVQSSMALLKEKVKATLLSNPWLAGRLTTSKRRAVQLTMPPWIETTTHENHRMGEVGNDDNTDDSWMAAHFVEATAPIGNRLRHDAPWEDIAAASRGFVVGLGQASVDQADAALFRVTVVASPYPTRGGDAREATNITNRPLVKGATLALVVSMSHILGDGVTFYQVIALTHTHTHARYSQW